MLIQTIGQNQPNVDLNLKPTPLSLPPLTFSPSLPNPQYLALSFCTLCLIPLYVLPVQIPHKKCMMFHYDYHCLFDNKRLRTHLLFHLYLEYNTYLNWPTSQVGIECGSGRLKKLVHFDLLDVPPKSINICDNAFSIQLNLIWSPSLNRLAYFPRGQ